MISKMVMNIICSSLLLIILLMIGPGDETLKGACRYMLDLGGTELLKYVLLNDNMIKHQICGVMAVFCMNYSNLLLKSRGNKVMLIS